MTKCSRGCLSTISRKQIMALAGLGLCLFVLTHVLGNFLLFVSPEAYNTYAHKLTSNPLIYGAEVGLVTIFGLHILAAIVLTIINRGARKTKYAMAATGDKATSKTTKTMWWQGVVILFFVINHIIMFKYGTYYEAIYNGEPVRDLFRLVFETFQSPVFVIWYVAAVSILGFHLSHGFYSSFQTLGVNHPKYTPIIKKISIVYGLFIGLGFMSQPLYMFFVYKG